MTRADRSALRAPVSLTCLLSAQSVLRSRRGCRPRGARASIWRSCIAGSPADRSDRLKHGRASVASFARASGEHPELGEHGDALGHRALALGQGPRVALGIRRRARVVQQRLRLAGAARRRGRLAPRLAASDRAAPRPPARAPAAPTRAAAPCTGRTRPRPGRRCAPRSTRRRARAAPATAPGSRGMRRDQVRERVGVVVVDPALGDDRLRPEGAAPPAPPPRPSRAGRPRRPRRAAGRRWRWCRARRAAGLAGEARSGEEVAPALVHRHGQDAGVLVEDPLGAVAVVHVQVDVGHPVEARPPAGR